MRKGTANAAVRGFTLIELMVGLVIGLLTVLVITQVMAMAEGKKRTTSMGNDAQVNGALALFTMQRDIEQAGYGATANSAGLGCTVNAKNASSAAFQFTLAPVVIAVGASNGPDTITILQGNTPGFSAPMLLTGAHLQNDNHFAVSSSLGAVAGNMMIAVPQTVSSTNTCTLFNVTTDTSGTVTQLGNTNVPHVTGATGPWNPAAAQTQFPSSGYAAGDYLVNVGSMVLRAYTVDSANNLVVSDRSAIDGTVPSPPPEVYPQIVNLKALYGKDTNGDGVIDAYDTTTPTTSAGWAQVQAIRIAVVARSAQFEKDAVTPTAPLWNVGGTITIAGSSACYTNSMCIPLQVSQVGTDWQHYRYKVYDTIVPLRNVLWSN